jgi:Phage portal protein, SPP1 Gp6-like
MSAKTDRNKQLLQFLDRRHPLYGEMVEHWNFLEATYEGGRTWFDSNVFRYVKEGDREFGDRVERAYRFNHTREVVDLVDKHLFKLEVTRSQDVPQQLTDFWKKSTLQGQPIREFMRSVSKAGSIYGRPWVVVDSTKAPGVRTRAQEKATGARVYAYIVSPQHMLDMSYDDQGELNWCLIHEVVRDDSNPIESSGALKDRYRLWTRTYSQVFKIEKQGNSRKVVEEAQIPHTLGVVPVLAADNVLNDEKWTAPAMIADVAYLDRAVANYLSNLDAIIQDQTFSQLAMPAQGLGPDDDPYTKLLEMGTKRIFIYDGGQGGNQPFFLSPDVKQAELILKVINKIINEIYHSVGLAGERTKEDNAVGIDNSSGVAKAYDFERVNSLLAAKADSLESFENRLSRMVMRYHGQKNAFQDDKPPVSYPDDFDVRGLYDEFEIASRLALIEAPEQLRRYQMEQLIDKMFPRLKKELRVKMMADLKSWPPKLEVEAGTSGSSGTSAIKAAGKQTLAAEVTGSQK